MRPRVMCRTTPPRYHRRMKLRTEDVTWQEIDGELVILDLTRSTYLTTNQTGAFLTKLLVEETTEDALADALVAEFGIERSEAADDVGAFLGELRKLELLA